MRMKFLVSLSCLLVAGATACGGAASFNAGGALNQAPVPAAPAAPAAVVAPADKDGDGVADADDQCPDKAGSATAAKKGCPEEQLAEVVGEDIKVHGKILFATGNANLDTSDDGILDKVAEIMKAKKDIELVEIEGHADHQGDAKQNATLTDNRAKSVMEALVKRGVEKNRLVAKGYGEYCPIEQGDTPQAHETNRRVEFKILKHGGKATGIATGCANAEKMGIKPAKF